MYKPCNSRCKCKSNCRNPHNNGRTCARCEQQDDIDDIASDDEEQAPERLPIVTCSADAVDTNTESDDSDKQADLS